MYAVKVAKIARMPLHLRWELQPIPGEAVDSNSLVYPADIKQWEKQHKASNFKGVLHLLKENFCFTDYFKTNRWYWLSLLPWHIGFILIVAFHILCFLGAVVIIAGIMVSPESTALFGKIFFYLIMVCGLASFILGTLGSIGLIIRKQVDRNLKAFTTAQNYFNYVFTLVVFLSGLYSWYFADPTFSGYLQFWKGMITLHPAPVEYATIVHIILFALFLIYLPFTRSTHYITKFLAFLWVRWDDRPNTRGGKMERDIEKLLSKPVSWSAPHIQSGKTWAEIASGENSQEK